jgi:hypothetical protein
MDKQNDCSINNEIMHSSITEMSTFSSDKTSNNNFQTLKENCVAVESVTDQNNKLSSQINFNIKHNTLGIMQQEIHQNQETYKNKTNCIEIQTSNNVKNKKHIEQITNIGNIVYFDKRIVDGTKEKITGSHNSEILDEMSSLPSINNTIFTDLPPLNGKKTNMNDLKDLMDIGTSYTYTI